MENSRGTSDASPSLSSGPQQQPKYHGNSRGTSGASFQPWAPAAAQVPWKNPVVLQTHTSPPPLHGCSEPSHPPTQNRKRPKVYGDKPFQNQMAQFATCAIQCFSQSNSPVLEGFAFHCFFRSYGKRRVNRTLPYGRSKLTFVLFSGMSSPLFGCPLTKLGGPPVFEVSLGVVLTQ